MTRHYTMASFVLAVMLLAGGIVPAAHAQPHPVAAATTPGSHGASSSGVWYEIFVRSWYDTHGDGIGDLNGVTAKLDYLKSLGVSGIWLTPINPSPSYHGYDVTDYLGINPQFGSMADFERLLREAHKRGIKVIMDLVINHTSNQHPWFKAAQDPHSPYHDWYVWAGTKTNLHAISAAGGPAWHAAVVSADGKPASGSPYYLGVFGRNMPDLNYDDPAVRREMIKVGQFWLKKGVDGFRLDAAKHIYVNFKSDDDNPHAIARNVAWWKQFHEAMRKVEPKVFLVGEVSAEQEIQLAPYYAALNSVFNFPLADTLVDSARSEQSADLGCRVARALHDFDHDAGGPATDTPFVSNHDQNRLFNKLDGNRNHMRMAAAMLLTLPGQPFIYYGQEIGMRGAKPDPRIREPMRWELSTDARGETTWEKPILNLAPEVSVAAEQGKAGSMLEFYRMLIHWRSALPALRDGSISSYPADRGAISAYVRADAQQRLLVVHNLSGKPQTVKLLAGHFGKVIRRSRDGIQLEGHLLTLPAYSTAILN